MNAKIHPPRGDEPPVGRQQEDSCLASSSTPSRNRPSIPSPKDGHELVYDQKHWKDFVPKRKGSKERVQHHSERELEIERRLQTPVLLKYQETPLSEVMGGLSELTGVNIHLDPRGLSQEGVNSDTPVTINLSKEISLKSALNLILEPLHLSYVVSDEVLKITSEQLRDGEIYTRNLQRGRPRHADPEFRSEQQHRSARTDQRVDGRRRPRLYWLWQYRPDGSGQRPRTRSQAVGPNGGVLAQQIGSQPAARTV